MYLEKLRRISNFQLQKLKIHEQMCKEWIKQCVHLLKETCNCRHVWLNSLLLTTVAMEPYFKEHIINYLCYFVGLQVTGRKKAIFIIEAGVEAGPG